MLEPLPYKGDVEKGISKLMDPETQGMPVGRNTLARMAQQFALARYAFNYAKGEYEAMRLTILSKINKVLPPGEHWLCDTAQISLVAQVTEGPRRLNEAAIVQELMERFDLETDEAAAFIDKCKIQGEPVIKLQVTPKR
jgi:hypothetical protein